MNLVTACIRLRSVCLIAISILSPSPFTTAQQVPDDAERFPFVIPGDDAFESLTSRRVLLDAPAGKAGFVRVQDGHFYAGDGRIRFWGVNLCFAGNFPKHEDADTIAPHMAKLGINAVRFHHMDGQSAPSGVWARDLVDGHRVFDDEMVDRLDYFLAKLHENGIYADLNMHCSRTLSEAEGFPPLTGAPWWAGANKWVMYYDADVQSKVKDYCREMLTHKNPYRNHLARVDDPGIALVEMLNENYFSKQGYSLYRKLPRRFQSSLIKAWNRWLTTQYGDTKNMVAQWGQRQPILRDPLFDPSFDPGATHWQYSLDEIELPRSIKAAEIDGVGKVPAVRFEPKRRTEENHGMQLSVVDLTVEADSPYTFECWVRSDEPRSVGIELSTAQNGDWRSLGMFENVASTTQWTKISRVVFPSESIADGANLRLNFGMSAVPVEFAGVSFRPGAAANALPKDQTLESLSVAIPDAGSPVAAHGDMRRFMVETEIAWVTELKRFLQEDLGVKVPIIASQANYHTPEVNLKLNDFIDVHNYWHHPMFPAGAMWSADKWTVGNEPMEADPTRSDWPTNSLLMRTGWRYANKPMTLTEWNYPEPSPYSSGCVPLAASLAALQDWDAVFFFDFDASSKTSDDWNRNQTINFFSFNGQPVKLANLSVFANVFLRGDLAPLRNQRLAPIGSPIDGRHALTHRLAVSPTVTKAPSLPEPSTNHLSTPDGRLSWKSEPPTKGFLKINTGRTQGVWGTIGNQNVQTKDLKWQVGSIDPNYATLVLTSQDDAPITKSRKLLLLASTHTENKHMGWNAQRNSVGKDWGQGPTQVMGMNAKVTLENKQVTSVYALDGKGRRVVEIPTKRKGDAISFEISPKYQTLWYEVSGNRQKAKPFAWINPLPKLDAKGLKHGTFESRLAKQKVGYGILLPEGYASSDARYPVVYYLHGGRPGSEAKSVRLAEQMVRIRKENELAPVIYVFVNGGPVSHYNVPDRIGVAGQPDANGADVFIQELIPHIDATYRTIPDRSARGLEGFSQGGRGTMRLSLRYPELFSSVAAGGGGYATEKRISESPDSAESELLRFSKGDNTWDLARRYADRNDAPKLNLMIYVGTDGFNYENNLDYMEFLQDLGIAHRPLIVPDVPHSGTKIYEKQGLEIMRFHERNFRR